MMQYRLIHFVPDRVKGARFPIAAAVRVGAEVHLVLNPNQPGPRCLGSDQRAAAMSLLRQSLRYVTTFDSLPDTFAPHAILDEAREIPQGIRSENALNWVKLNVLEGPSHDDLPVSERRSSPHRATYGYSFFQRWGVRQFVQRRFTPTIHAAAWNWPAEWSNSLRPISHWIAASGRLLLMEPIVPFRETFEKEVKEIGTDFLAYREATRHIRNGHEPELIAYVLRGADQDAMDFVHDSLGKAPTAVVHTAIHGQAESFTRRIRQLGEGATPPLY